MRNNKRKETEIQKQPFTRKKIICFVVLLLSVVMLITSITLICFKSQKKKYSYNIKTASLAQVLVSREPVYLQEENGKLIPYQAGTPAKNYTGWVNKDNDRYLVKNGEILYSYTGAYIYRDSGYYVNQGKIDFSYSGLAQDSSGKWWRVKDGVINTAPTIVKNENSSDANNTDVPKSSVKTDEVGEAVNIDDMSNDLKSDSAKAAEKYKNKEIDIEGLCTGTTSNNGESYILLKAKDNDVMFFVQVKENKGIVNSLQTGDTVRVKGVVSDVDGVAGYDIEAISVTILTQVK